MKRFWSLVLLHHYAAPVRWKLSAAITALLLGGEALIFLLPPLPPTRLLPDYFKMFLVNLADYEILFLMTVLVIPLFLMTAGFQDLGGKVFSLTLPVSRAEYFWARVVYSILPITAVAVPYLILLFLTRDSTDASSFYANFAKLYFLTTAYLFFLVVFLVFLLVGWFVRRGEIALLVALILSAVLGAVQMLATAMSQDMRHPVDPALTQLFYLVIATVFARWLVAKADVGQEAT